MKRQSATSNMVLTASELAKVLTESITATFVNLGIVQVTAHPSSVPSSVPATPAISRATRKAASITGGRSQGRIVAPSLQRATASERCPNCGADESYFKGTENGIRCRRCSTTIMQLGAPASEGNTRKARSISQSEEKPDFGEASCVVGENRTKLPKAIFEGLNGIILRFDDGRQHSLKTDVEGRGRLTRNQTDDIGAFHSQGHYLVFMRDEQFENVYDVVIWSPKGRAVSDVKSTIEPASCVVAPASKGVTRRSEGTGITRASKPEPTPAQKRARAEFARKAKSGAFRRKGTSSQVAAPVAPARLEVTKHPALPFPSVRITDGSELEGMFEDEVRTIDNGRVRPIYVTPNRRTPARLR